MNAPKRALFKELLIFIDMSVPSLRQPKVIKTQLEDVKETFMFQPDFVILTLRNEDKLVVSSDAYHGILTVEMEFKCVFCRVTMGLDSVQKKNHKKSSTHLTLMNENPFIESFSQNLIKQVCELFIVFVVALDKGKMFRKEAIDERKRTSLAVLFRSFFLWMFYGFSLSRLSNVRDS